MKCVLAVALMTFKEAAKQRVIYGTSITAIALLTLSVMISGFFMRDISKILVDFSLSVTTLGGLLIPIFIAVNMLSGDLEKRTAFTILSRPVARWQYIIGKFSGLSLLLLSNTFLLSIMGLVAVYAAIKIYGIVYFKNFSILSYIMADLSVFMGINILLALVIMWSTLTTSSFLATILTLASYFIGQAIDDIVAFINNNPVYTINSLLKSVINILKYIVPDLASFDLKLAAAHSLVIPFKDILYLFSYSTFYIAAVLSISILVFNGRDIT